MKILAIDDTPLILVMLQGVLQKEYEMTVLSSPLAALELLDSEKFDLILLDVLMPVMNGFDAFLKIREKPNAATTPIIFLTGADDRDSEQKGLELGAVDFIFKPIRTELVKLRIRNTLELARMARDVKTSEERLRYVMAATGEGVWDWNVETGQVIHNLSWCRMLGLDDKMQEHPVTFFSSLIHPDDEPAVSAALNAGLRGEDLYRSEHRMRHASGTYVWVLDRGQVVQRAEDGRPLRMVGSIANIDARKRDEAEIRRLVFFDTLTQLPNRRLLIDRLEQALIKTKRNDRFGALMFLDLDRFKQLNDTHGHAMGDELLVQVGQRLTEAVRQQDTVARLGGDEFVVLMEGLAEQREQAREQARQIAKNLLAALNQPYDLGDLCYSSTPSIGFTLFDHNSQTIDEILGRADKAMYAAKTAGRNTIRSDEDSPAHCDLHNTEKLAGLSASKE